MQTTINQDKLSQVICEVMNVSWEQIIAPNRGKIDIAIARQLYHYFQRVRTGESLKSIGIRTNRHYSTIISSVRTVQDMLKQNDPIYTTPYLRVMERMKTI